MERLRLGTTGAELIKKRLTFPSRRTSARNPTVLLSSVRRENNNKRKGDKWSMWSKDPTAKETQWGTISLHSRGR